MKKLKENKAITLVALVITIIILLILAGISIAQLTGNGLFSKSQLAKQESENARLDEQDKIDRMSNEIDEITGNGSVSADKISFTPSDSTWKAKDGSEIKNVKQALDSLYGD